MCENSGTFGSENTGEELRQDESNAGKASGTKRAVPPFWAHLFSKEPKMADRETIIETGGGSGAGIIGGIVVVALLVLGFFLFVNNNGGGGTVDVDVPAVTVDVQPDGQ
jgi:hypothetical protein